MSVLLYRNNNKNTQKNDELGFETVPYAVFFFSFSKNVLLVVAVFFQ